MDELDKLIIEIRKPLHTVKGDAEAKATLIAWRDKEITKARLEELENLPWKRNDKYGVNSPYVTKEWLVNRKAELKKDLE